MYEKLVELNIYVLNIYVNLIGRGDGFGCYLSCNVLNNERVRYY